ncbi:hypothetical protein DMENIID0001_006160 [Sergentomyia squamirostris]
MFLPSAMPGMYGMPPGSLYQMPTVSGGGPGMPQMHMMPQSGPMSHPQHVHPPQHMMQQAMAGMSLSSTNVTPSMVPAPQQNHPQQQHPQQNPQQPVPPQMQNGHSSMMPPIQNFPPQQTFTSASFSQAPQMPLVQSQLQQPFPPGTMPPPHMSHHHLMMMRPMSQPGPMAAGPDKTNIPVYQQQR